MDNKIIEDNWEKLLNIHTTGTDIGDYDPHKHPYEATPYEVLEKIYLSGYIKKDNVLIDYGCGKGRVSIFLSSQTKCKSIGIDYNKRLIDKAVENKKSSSARRVEFINCLAEDYIIPADADRFYFFNPFTNDTYRKVLDRIEESYKINPREIMIFLYYPHEDFISMTRYDILDEIKIEDNNPRERVIIYKIEG